MTSRKFCAYFACVVLTICACGASFAQESPSLPEIDGWRCGELRSVSFDAVSENYGYWQERDYLIQGAPLKAILMYGAGPKFYNLPPNGVSGDDGPIGAGAEYEIISVGGYRSLIERHPILGYSVSVNAFEKKFSLTVESGPWAGRDELIRCAEILLAHIIQPAGL